MNYYAKSSIYPTYFNEHKSMIIVDVSINIPDTNSISIKYNIGYESLKQ